MQPLTVTSAPQQTYKTPPQAAQHWVRQLVALFPSTSTEITEEMIASMVLIFTQYPESLLKEICSPLTGMPTNFEFLPGLFRFKGYCDQKATEAYDHDRRVREAIRPPAHEPLPDPAGKDYTGPIDQVQPGDILHSTRYDEYREFMRTKKNITYIKLWGTNEEWIDNHQRPFSGVNINPPPNPFE